jgi:hypothetical protein
LNLFELFVKIGVDDQASKKIADISGKIGKGLKTAAKVGTAAVGTAMTGITALTSLAIKNYAEYQQLVGGVDTLFKDASEKVKGYANDAYKTAGMSANDYMSNVTAFSASLISSLGDDTEAAAEYGHRAMVSMSDNANKMGTNIDSIVQTYQSLSRGNFAMLDNLKLGYGGTKAELERLIADASTYTDIQKEMGITVDASSTSFDNIVNAIAVVQGKLGIAGATALEAGTTIEGSVNSMKSAWQNLITGIADDNADFETLVDDFVTTIVGDGSESNLGVFGNILPRIEIALDGAIKLIEGLFPKIIDELPDLIETLVPSLIDGAVNIITALVDGLEENADMLGTMAVTVAMKLINGILSMLPKIISLGLDLIIALAKGISENLDTLIPSVIDCIRQIVETLTDPEMLNELLDTALVLILELADGILYAIPELVDVAMTLIENLTIFLLDPENMAKIINVALQLVIAIAGGIISAIPTLIESTITLIDDVIEQFDNTDWWQVGSDIIDGLLQGLKDAWYSISNWFSDKWNELTNPSVDGFSGGANSSRRINGSHAGGLAYVPFDGYIARLHKGERVLTAEEANRYSQPQRYGGTTDVNVTVGIDDSANALGLARALLPFLKIAQKEAYA